MVNQDEITFIGQKEEEVSTAETGLIGGMDRPLMARLPRQLVIFTAGSHADGDDLPVLGDGHRHVRGLARSALRGRWWRRRLAPWRTGG